MRGCPPDAVFCANPACHKALGEFDYVLERLRAEAHWHEALAERVTNFIGRPHFLGFHLLWFVLWALVNTGIFAFVRRFDDYPFSLVGILLAVEAIFITGSQTKRQSYQCQNRGNVSSTEDISADSKAEI